MAQYLISDLHLDHANIIDYCDRPFDTVDEMNTTLITNWNHTVSPTDDVLFLGDLCMTQEETHVIDRLADLTYDSLIFIEGNHDPITPTTDSALPTRQYHYLAYDDWQFCLTHRPERVPQDWHGWVIHGHTHNNELRDYPFVNPDAKTVNVSADVLNYTPVALSDLTNILTTGNRYQTIASAPTTTHD